MFPVTLIVTVMPVIMLLKSYYNMMTFRGFINIAVGSPVAEMSETFFHAYSFLLKDMISICVLFFN